MHHPPQEKHMAERFLCYWAAIIARQEWPLFPKKSFPFRLAFVHGEGPDVFTKQVESRFSARRAAGEALPQPTPVSQELFKTETDHGLTDMLAGCGRIVNLLPGGESPRDANGPPSCSEVPVRCDCH